MKKSCSKENWISLVIPTWWILLWMCTKIFILMKFLMVSCSFRCKACFSIFLSNIMNN